MNIVLVMDYSLDYVGGAQRALLDQATALAQLDCEVTIIGFARHMQIDRGVRSVCPRQALYIPIIKFPLYRNTRRLRSELGTLFERLRPDLVMVQSEFGLAHAAVDAARAQQLPTAQTVHTISWNGPRLPLPLGIMRFAAERLCGHAIPLKKLGGNRIGNVLRSMTLAMGTRVDTVISPSRHQANDLEYLGLHNVIALPNVTSFDRQLASDESLSAEGELTTSRASRASSDMQSTSESITAEDTKSAPLPLRLLWVGRPAPEKNLPLATAAVELAAAHGLDVHLIVAGPKRQTQGKIVRAIGEVSHETLRSEYAAADAVLLTSDGFDNLPMVAIEGFANGVPLITVDKALKDEFGAAAILSADATIAGLASTLEAFAHNAALRAAAKQGAIEYADQITASAYLHRLEQLSEASETKGQQR